MSDSAIAELASTIQSASINRQPDPEHDMNPSTAASEKQPVQFKDSSPDDVDDAKEDEIPISVLQPSPRRPSMPPLPDLRFEQSYLKSIENAQGWQMVTYITFRDQFVLPLVQGALWTLIVAGWKHVNRDATFSGRNVGARIRRWWWGVNNWPIPGEKKRGMARFRMGDEKLAGEVKEVSRRFIRVHGPRMIVA